MIGLTALLWFCTLWLSWPNIWIHNHYSEIKKPYQKDGQRIELRVDQKEKNEEIRLGMCFYTLKTMVQVNQPHATIHHCSVTSAGGLTLVRHPLCSWAHKPEIAQAPWECSVPIRDQRPTLWAAGNLRDPPSPIDSVFDWTALSSRDESSLSLFVLEFRLP